MKRKIIKQGLGGYTIYLPKKWIDENKLKYGDELQINEEDSKLIVHPIYIKSPEVAIRFDLADYNERTVRNILNQTYRKGFDKITLKYHTKQQLEDVKEITRKTLLGFEVTKETDDVCVVQNIAEPSSTKFDVILRKIFLIIKQESQEMLEDIKSGKLKNLQKRKEQKDIVDHYTNFTRRVIIRNKIEGTKDSYLLFYLVSKLSIAHHAYYYLYAFLNKKKKFKLGKDIIKLLGETNEMYNTFYNAFYKKNIELNHKVGVLKDKLLKNDVYKLLQKKKGIENVVLYRIGEIIRNVHLCSTVLFGLIKKESD